MNKIVWSHEPITSAKQDPHWYKAEIDETR